MFAYKCQLILGQRQPPHNVLDEVVGCHCRQVPLQLPQHHQFPLLEREREGETEGDRGTDTDETQERSGRDLGK